MKASLRTEEAGALAGLFAGVLMFAALMTWSASMGQGFWAPLQLVGGTFLGVKAVLGGAGAGALGAVLHLATSAFWGMLFAALVTRSATAGQAAWAGLLYGAAVWAFMTFAALPVLDRTMEARVMLIPGAWFACHLVYGAALFVTPALLRTFSELPVAEEELRPYSEPTPTL